MDAGRIIYISSRLTLGALTAFFAIMLWSRTRDPAWMLMVIGTIAAYVETVYSILVILGITGTMTAAIGSVPLASIVLSNLPTLFFLSAFLVMVFRKYRKKRKSSNNLEDI
jgi:membrane protein implicated in regulation of membrane protease activity